MILASTTLAILACQGCVAVPASGVAATNTPVTYTRTTSYSYTPVNAEQTPGPVVAGVASVNRSDEVARLGFAGIPDTDTPNPVFVTQSLAFSPATVSSSDIVSGFAANRVASRLSMPARDSKDVTAEFALSATAAQTGLGFDVGVAPRISVRKDGDFETQRFGGELRIGQGFDQRGENVESKSWYMFAGADGEALVWEPGDARSGSNMNLRDQVTVGDMQAGISLKRGSGQLSFSYIRREVKYEDRLANASETEDFAGVSFTIRR